MAHPILSGVLKAAFISESRYDEANATKIHEPIKYQWQVQQEIILNAKARAQSDHTDAPAG